MGHTKGRLWKGGIGKGKETKTWMRLMWSLYRSEYRNFKLAWPPWEAGWGGVKREWLINWSYNTHMHGNKTRKLPSLSQTSKTSCFLFYLLLLFFFYKIKELCRTGSEAGGVLALVRGEGGKERGSRMNVVQTMYTHVCKWKNDACLNCSRNQGRKNGGQK
jgi:hypothetical protein